MAYYQVSLDELKRVCPSLDQQVILQVPDEYLIQDESGVVINEGQQIVYQQQPSQQQQNSQYVIQSNDELIHHQQQQALAHQQQQQLQQQQVQQQSQIYYTNEQLINQSQQQQIEQPIQQNQHIVYRTVTRAPAQTQQVLNNQNVIVQQTAPQQVIIQQQQPQHQQTVHHQQPVHHQQHQQQTQQVVMRSQQMPQQRIVYTTGNRGILYTQTTTQQQTQQQQQQILQQQQHMTQQQQTQQRYLQQRATQLQQQTSQQQQQQVQVQQQPMQQNVVYQTTAVSAAQQQQPTPPTMPARAVVRPANRMPGVTAVRGVTRGRATLITTTTHATVANNSAMAKSAPRGRTTTPRGTGRGGRGRGAAIRATTPVTQMRTDSPVTVVSPTGAQVGTRQVFANLTTATGLAQHRLIQHQVQQKLLQQQGKTMATASSSTSTTPVRQVKSPQTGNGTSSTYPSNSLDIEDSIQAVVVKRTPEHKNALTTLTAYNTDSDSDERKMTPIKVQNAPPNTATFSLAEYKKKTGLRAGGMPVQRFVTANAKNSPSTSQTGTSIPVHRVAPMPQKQLQTQQMPSAEPSSSVQRVSTNNYEIQTQHVIQNRGIQQANVEIDRNSARMLVILASGEQRLITFTLPRESCTVQDLLEQVGVPFDSKTTIQCVENPGANIDFVVTVGFNVQESPSELISRAEQSLQLSRQQEGTVTSTTQATHQPQQPSTSQAQQPQVSKASTSTAVATVTEDAAAKPEDVPKKLIKGFLAVCQYCGFSGYDHAKCERCKRVFHEEPRRMSYMQNLTGKADDDKKSRCAGSDLLSRGQVKANAALAGSPGRGRGGIRGRARNSRRQAEAEPVILCLSSDDDDDNEKSSQSALKNSGNTSVGYVVVKPFSFEPNIAEDDSEMYTNFVRENVADIGNHTDKLITTFSCKLIRIGTHRYEPKNDVIFTSKGVRIFAPSCNNPDDQIVLDIMANEIVKIIAHFSKNFSVLFMYTLRSCGQFVRESLEMKSKSVSGITPYYNPTDRSEPYKRIVLQLDVVTEEKKSVIKSIFPESVLEEISASDANELLIRSAAKDKFIAAGSSEMKTDMGNEIRQILIYPQGRGGISMNTEDYMCLATDQYLNDVIIDFYLKWLHINKLTAEQQERTHIFSTFFYKRLTTMNSRHRQTDKDVKLTAAQKRHARVANWTKNVNLFEKDFVIIPINEQSHWFLAIVCFPELKGPVTFDTNEPVVAQQIVKKKKKEKRVSLQIGNTTITPLSKKDQDSVCVGDDDSERDEAEGDDSDLASDDSDFEGTSTTSATLSQNRPIKQPLILIFDSLAGASRNRVVATLRDYLTCEYKAKIKENSTHTFNKLNMPGHCVKVPQQNNFTDCGLYLLQYVEQFFHDPITDYRLPIKQLVNWFETIVVTRKREEISNLLKSLVEEYNPDQLPLPEVQFPTIEGRLVEPEEGYNDEQAEFEEEEMEEETLEEEEEATDETPSPEKTSGRPHSNSMPNIAPQGTKIILKRNFSDIAGLGSPVVRKNAKLDN